MYNNLSIPNSNYELNLDGLTSEEVYSVAEMISCILEKNYDSGYEERFEAGFRMYYRQYLEKHPDLDEYQLSQMGYENPAHQYATRRLFSIMNVYLRDEWIEDFKREAMDNPTWAPLYSKVFVHSHLRESRRLQSIFHENRNLKRKLYEFEYTDDGLTQETAYNFISAAFKLNNILGYRDYSHSDFTSITVSNTDKENRDWARYIGGNFAIFEDNAEQGYSATRRETLNIVSKNGSRGLAINWSAGAGGNNSKTELAEKFFGGYYQFSPCLQQAFGGPKSSVWKDEEAALNLIKWSETVESITDFIKATTLRKNVTLFTTLKNFMLDWSQVINEKLATIDVANLDYFERSALGPELARQALDEIEIPESLQNLESFKIDNTSSIRYIWLRVGNVSFGTDVERNKETNEYEFVWTTDNARKYYTMEEMIDYCGKNVKFTNSFDPATFAAGQY